MAVPSDAAEHRQTAASRILRETHPWLAKVLRRSPLWVVSWFIVAIAVIERAPVLRLARFFGSVARLFTHGPVVTVVCATIALVTIIGGICFLAWLRFQGWRERKRLQHELHLLLRLAEIVKTASTLDGHGGAQFSTLLARLVEVVLTRHLLETAVKVGDRTDKPASHEDGRVMPASPRQDAPGSEHPPSHGVL